MPEGVSDRLLAQVTRTRSDAARVDVSEFLKKGGGTVKCMIGDLGPIRPDQIRGNYAPRFRGGPFL